MTLDTNYLYDYIVNQMVYDNRCISLMDYINIYELLDYHYTRYNRQACPYYEVKYCSYDVRILDI